MKKENEKIEEIEKDEVSKEVDSEEKLNNIIKKAKEKWNSHDMHSLQVCCLKLRMTQKDKCV